MVVGLPYTLMQTGYANHLKVLCSKDAVLNVQAKGFALKGGQVSVKKLNASEPLMKCRKVTC